MEEKRYNHTDQGKSELTLTTLTGSPIDMGGTYNDPNGGGYDFCRRGIEIFFAPDPGGPFDAEAKLTGGHSDPFYHLEVRRSGGSGVSRIYKEEVPSQPASRFKSHAYTAGTYQIGATVAVSVSITSNGQGVEVQVTKK